MNPRFPCPLLLVVLLAASGHTQSSPDLKFDIGAVDRSANPCADFYQYACGGWMAHNPIPANRAYWAVFQQMRDVNQKRVVDILEHGSEVRPDRLPNEQQIGDYFASCRDETTIEAKGLDPL